MIDEKARFERNMKTRYTEDDMSTALDRGIRLQEKPLGETTGLYLSTYIDQIGVQQYRIGTVSRCFHQ